MLPSMHLVKLVFKPRLASARYAIFGVDKEKVNLY